MKKSKATVNRSARGGKAATRALERTRLQLRPWHYAAAAVVALFALLEIYGPALRGPFLFDDWGLPFTFQEFVNAPLRAWLTGVRPALMFTFWSNLRLSNMDPFSYHLFNLLFHLVNGALVFVVVRRLLGWAGTMGLLREGLAAFAAALFLVHPVQTESVAYVASRSEVLSVLFFYVAFTVFLYRRANAVSWPVALAILALFGAAVSTKEHTAMIPLVLLLTDYWFNPGFSFAGIRRNWRLYGLFVVGGVAASRIVYNVLSTAPSAGFQLKDVTWYEYFFTQGRVIWTYLRMFVLPFGQNIDPDVRLSHTVLQHGAIFGLAALAALAAAAIWYRRRFPLASYGYLLFLVLLAPTSSVMPIADPMAERRLYLPFLGLLLVALEFLRRWKAPRRTAVAALAGLLVVEGALAYRRNQVWTSDQALWEDASAKSPNKSRPQFQLGFAYYAQGRCADALRYYQRAAALATAPDYRLLADMAQAEACLQHWDAALSELRQAAKLENTAHVWSMIGRVLAQQGKRDEALAAFDTAVKIDPGYDTTYLFRGDLYSSSAEWGLAAAEYRRALAINPANDLARNGLNVAQARLRGLR